MAYTYIILNVVFIIAVLLVFRRSIHKPTSTWWMMLAALLVLTAVFDNLIILAGIVGYDSTKLLGLYVGVAPIEDFFYAILAAILIPILWQRFGSKTQEEQ
jgi:lycopene cyclase domain-containing protein